MRTDWTETGMMIFICVMMVIGGLSEGYPGLAIFGGFILAMFALAFILGKLTDLLPPLPEPVLYVLGLPLLAIAIYLVFSGDMQAWAILVIIGYIGLVVAHFLPSGEQTLKVKLPAIGVNLPEGFDVDSLPEGDLPGGTVTRKEFVVRPEDLGPVEEVVARLVLGPRGIDLKTSTVDTSERLAPASEALASGDPEAALAAVDSLGPDVKTAEASELRATALLELGRYQDALAALKDVPADKSRSSTHFLRAEAERRLGNQAAAGEAYDEAAAHAISEAASGTAFDLSILPAALLRLGRLDAAETVLQQLKAATPDTPGLTTLRLELALRRGAVDEANALVDAALQGDPSGVRRLVEDPEVAQILSKPELAEIRKRLTGSSL